ncbi:MAG: sodium:solute symporter family protein [Pirellulales bacterium]|nr:sodium:solute symporter family protein [Pirellulales bacterium]
MNLARDFGTNFTPWDWAIVGAYLVACVGAGVYVKRYVSDMSDYVVAGRSLNSFLSIATMLGSEIGLVTVMYAAQKGFVGGFAAFYIGLLGGVICLLVGLTGLFVVPLRRMGVMTIPQFYEQRFSKGVRIFGGVVLAVTGILNMGMFLRAGALFLTSLTGLSDPITIKIVMTILLLLVLLYTVLGGMLAVVITDYIQFVVLAVGMSLACIFALTHVGWSNMIDTVRHVHGDGGFDPIQGFGWGEIAQNALIVGLVSTAVWPTALMRVLSARDTTVVRQMYTWSSIGFMTRWIIPQFLGVCAMTYMWSDSRAHDLFFGPDGKLLDDPAHVDLTLQAMPLFLSQLLPIGAIGMILAGMIAAQMSTDSSYLLCWSSVLVEDVVNPLMDDKLSDRARMRLTRIFMLIIGAFLLIWSLWYPLSQHLWDYLAVTSAVYFTGAIALLLGGLYWPRASCAGAYLALGTGSLAILALGDLRSAIGLSWLSEPQIILGTTALALSLLIVGSLVWPDRRAPGNPALNNGGTR